MKVVYTLVVEIDNVQRDDIGVVGITLGHAARDVFGDNRVVKVVKCTAVGTSKHEIAV